MDVVARRELGTTGIQISVIGLGGNTFGPPRLDLRATQRVIDAALERGVNFVDTADIYGQGRSEEFLGQALGARRDRFVIATKFNLQDSSDQPTRQRVAECLDASLSRLGTDHIDLYQIHIPSATLPTEELHDALAAQVSAGKVRAIGACNHAAWRLERARHHAAATGTAAFASVQNFYNVLARQAEMEVIPWCRDNSTSFIPWQALGAGFLTGKYRPGEAAPAGSRGAEGSPAVDYMRTPENESRLDALRRFCDDRDRPLVHLALAWVLGEPCVASVITGVSSVEQLEVNLGAAGWELSSEERREIDRIVTGPNGVPGPEAPPFQSRMLRRSLG